MPTYREGDIDARNLVDEVMRAYHAPLAEAGVTVFVEFARATYKEGSDLPTGPAIKRDGMALIAAITVNSARNRNQGKKDVTLTVDEDWWKDASERQRRAAVDGQLQRIELDLLDEGNSASVQTDDACRPKLKKLPPDWAVSGFDCVIDRYGADALEFQSLAEVCRRPVVQRTFVRREEVA